MGADDDPGYGRRLLLALVAAVAFHVAVAAFAPGGRRSEPREDVTSALRITVAVRRPPAPRPSRTPTPTPPPTSPPPVTPVTPAPHVSLAPRIAVRVARAAVVPLRHTGGAAAPLSGAAAAAALVASPAPAAVATDGAGAGQAAGGAGTGAGPGSGDGGLAGTGTGTAGDGNAAANAGPCGDVYLLPGALAYRKDGTVVQQVLAKIVARDGSVTVDRFPYPFVYPAAKLNPFRYDSAVTAANGGIPVQQPPAGTDVATLPPGIQTVLRFTDPKTGYTSLPACNPAATPH